MSGKSKCINNETERGRGRGRGKGESTGRIREAVSLYSHPRCGKNMVMGCRMVRLSGSKKSRN